MGGRGAGSSIAKGNRGGKRGNGSGYKDLALKAYKEASKFIEKHGIPSGWYNHGQDVNNAIYEAISDKAKLTDIEKYAMGLMKDDKANKTIFWQGTGESYKGLTDKQADGLKKYFAHSMAKTEYLKELYRKGYKPRG